MKKKIIQPNLLLDRYIIFAYLGVKWVPKTLCQVLWSGGQKSKNILFKEIDFLIYKYSM